MPSESSVRRAMRNARRTQDREAEAFPQLAASDLKPGMSLHVGDGVFWDVAAVYQDHKAVIVHLVGGRTAYFTPSDRVGALAAEHGR